MSTDINFLPPEERPKRKQTVKKEREAVELSHPAAALGASQTSPAAPKDSVSPAKKAASRLFKLFKKSEGADGAGFAAVTDAVPLSRSNLNMQAARESLLKHIKGVGGGGNGRAELKSEGPASEAMSKISKAADGLTAGFNLSSERLNLEPAAKEKHPWLSLMQKLKRPAAKKLVRSAPPAETFTAPASAPPLAAPAAPKNEPRLTAELKEEVKSGPDVLRTNLIKGQGLAFFNWRRAVKINAAVIILAVLITGGAWGMLWLLSKREMLSSPISQRISAQEAELKRLRAAVAELNRLRQRVAAAKDILNSHVYWTNFFNYLENNTLPGIYYDEFEGELTGEYVLPAKARNFKDFSAQLKVWQEEQSYALSAKTGGAIIKKETQTIGEIKSEQEVISFEVNLKVKPEIFQAKE